VLAARGLKGPPESETETAGPIRAVPEKHDPEFESELNKESQF
jgi:hypothetical protein